ncbi:hypothetical protein MGG_17416 [Pyricularia oryzae 70-15]|uniref:Uncharacterized protein n=1 Tax=Pyricularia oryzae (strain 70-15 / ATCC MYA-4617 / FGSC 8958) TaxID=242507 RepID=G4NB90_PYRO7|nr:uncharacterized protein MGG_17416 [Pyricularia oryzae 70-15]EHA48852.1 hypothetical protein MGG_17416 [Pyricularia oryzae 70-15]
MSAGSTNALRTKYFKCAGQGGRFTARSEAVENDRFNMAPSRRKTSESFCYPDVPPRHAVHNAAENPAPLFCHEPAVGILYATLLSA